MKNCDFRVTAIVSNNHPANVLAYKLLLKESGHLDDDLFIEHEYQKIHLLHDAVHLFENVGNNWNVGTSNTSYFQLLNTIILKI